MKTCALHDFLQEMKPWLDKDYIRSAFLDSSGRFVLLFLDGTRNVYEIDDCTREQIDAVLEDLRRRGIRIGE